MRSLHIVGDMSVTTVEGTEVVSPSPIQVLSAQQQLESKRTAKQGIEIETREGIGDHATERKTRPH